MVQLLRTVLAPVLLVQGKHLINTLPRLPEAAGERTGCRGQGAPLRLLIVGDSAAAGVGVATQDDALLGQTLLHLGDSYQITYQLVARSGSTIPRTLRKLRTMETQPFDVAVTAIGVNDILAGRACQPWLASYQALVTELRERFSVRHIVVSGLPPTGQFPAMPQPLRWVIGRQTRQYDGALRTWVTTQPNCSFVGIDAPPGHPLHNVPMKAIMASDGFHPGPRIYAAWAERIAQTIRRVHLPQPLSVAPNLTGQ